MDKRKTLWLRVRWFALAAAAALPGTLLAPWRSAGGAGLRMGHPSGCIETEAEAAQYEAPFEYIREHVKPMRAANSRKVYAERWWIHAEARPDMREALKGLSRYLVTPCIAKHRIFAWLSPDVLPDHQLIVFAREDDAFFGLLHSHIHEVWALGQGTQLREKESGFRYTPTTCFETFPLPEPDEGKRGTVASAAKALDEARGNWLGDRSDKTRTLTNLYNKRPQWLVNAHAALDAAVSAAYGWPAGLPDDQILERLLALNLARADQENPLAAR